MLTKSFIVNRQELALIGVTMLWGCTFIIVQMAMRHADPFFFVGIRFCLAALGVGLIFRRYLRGLTVRELFAGSLIGLALMTGYGLQTVGLKTISSSMSAFITALYVPLVPLLQWLFLRRPPQLGNWLAIILCFIGLVLLSNPDPSRFTFAFGELVTVIGALAMAGEIILISRFAPGCDARRLTVVQLAVAGLAALAVMPLAGEHLPTFSFIWFGAAVGLACMSALIQLAMNWAQKSVSPTRATIIYAGEPVWAGIVGWLAGEAFTQFGLIGAALILAGILTCELFSKRRAEKSAQSP